VLRDSPRFQAGAEVKQRRSSTLKVFISSTSEDLEPHRLPAMDVIRDARWEPIGMEHFPADPRPTVQRCQEEIQKCGLVILLQAWRYGWQLSNVHRLGG
jgi:hypothetical protein